MFITIEGIDGSGKTYLAKRITNWLNANEKNSAVYTHEPYYAHEVEDGVEAIGSDYRPNPYYKDRIKHFANFILPNLEMGRHVVCDRFQLSTAVYQAETETLFSPVWNEYAFYVLPPSTWSTVANSSLVKDPGWLILIDPEIKDVANRLWERGEEVDTKDLTWKKNRFIELLGDFYRNSLAWINGPLNVIRAKTADEAFEQFTKRWNAGSDDDSED